MTDVLRKDVKSLRRQLNEVQDAVRDLAQGRNKRQRKLRKAGRRATHVTQDAGGMVRRHPAVTGLALVAITAAVAACVVQYGRH